MDALNASSTIALTSDTVAQLATEVALSAPKAKGDIKNNAAVKVLSFDII